MRTLETPTTRFAAASFAPSPPARRDDVRLLVARPSGVAHARFADLPDQLRAGDVVVVNDSATVNGEIDARSARHGPVVLHAATPLDDETWVVEVRTAPHAARAVLDAVPGERFTIGPHTVVLQAPYPEEGSSPTGQGDRLWRASVNGDLAAYLAAHGRPIAYGYLDRRYPLSAYQTVFGIRAGSAEMPSAGRPFTTALVTSLVARGVAVAPITLHTGVSSQEVGEGPQPERFSVPDATARLVNAVRAGGGRVVAVGTTVTRALESAVAADGRLVAASGWTTRVVTPAEPPRVVTGLVTGWHDPQASHLLLVEAVAGAELSQLAYDAAVSQRYAWHEFGDSCLMLP
ncbi:S-adenosylmethionine:tRNA ribosyltransferase-isomerase [Nocardioides mangrovicus]|uniref:S-adenosylmethionine:tRNA ribosyltransferase-isomerase n=1 Tax=Nocardioides mangrovicus TaxID=2478913 RepID=A0A3L8P3A9_9ACTN|nr:S-adenosylmethionine:tRNA ribosyltransferase-isomerase [Nocardioides mangrovicus]RLV48938.1 S-adenosylmethionine:tRNA ribosyltransferase-isomerase [Nocardioides mangrovicus]